MVAQLRAREKPQEHANMDRRGNGINNHHEILKPLKGWKLRLAWAQRSPQPSTRLFLTPPQRSRLPTIRELYYQVAENLAPIECILGGYHGRGAQRVRRNLAERTNGSEILRSWMLFYGVVRTVCGSRKVYLVAVCGEKHTRVALRNRVMLRAQALLIDILR
ncbi:hypothetical protein PPROV_000975100 [Pycnococcus provasolii]|uniref:Uncharacterized protein n=1 Tax=Pycnococcus provasolii TaxID=41880 RepID=A0A830I003_9CHLO|nr:hypothetical protein PPROV_000975100 [Pycnococcus provasolii]